MMLGCIADDFTGATDLGSMLVKGGMRAVQAIGVPTGPLPEADAVVIALKTRTIDSRDAIRQSLTALRWLKANGAQQIYFKVCSTFDSTPDGNIGPVAEALMIALNTDFSIACPAFPENGRTVFRGHLFVGDVLLSDSGMKDHPLTPMTDANLVRVLQAQTVRKVGLVRFDTVARGAAAIRERFAALRADRAELAIVDAVSDADLLAIGEACEDMPLVTAGSGVGLGLALNARAKGRLAHAGTASALPRLDGAGAVIAGSCSTATNAQVAHWRGDRPAFRIDALALADGKPQVDEALDWARQALVDGPVLIYATSPPEEMRSAQARLGAAAAGKLVEDALARIARGLVDAGVRKLVVAGGETSGAVVQALGVKSLRIGPQIDPGVPWTLADGDPAVALALKSGNFGSVDFFAKALENIA
jgi:uncharacterized protein YgbK (DUF1537 family)